MKNISNPYEEIAIKNFCAKPTKYCAKHTKLGWTLFLPYNNNHNPHKKMQLRTLAKTLLVSMNIQIGNTGGFQIGAIHL